MDFVIAPFQVVGEMRPLILAWERAFAEPPNGPRLYSELRDQLHRHATQPGFVGFLAQEPQSGEILGLIYGYTNAPGQWWRDRVAMAVGTERAGPLLDDTYCLTDLGVIPLARRSGIAVALVTVLLAHQPHPRALLSTRSDNHAGLAFYRRTGWQTAVPHMSFGYHFPPYDILEHTASPKT